MGISSAEELLLRISGDASGGQKAVKDIVDSVGAMEPPVKSATSAVSELSGVLAGLLSAGAFIEFGRSVLDAGDHIQKMADQTGESAENVQRLMYIAGQSGSSIEGLVGAVQNLEVRLGTDDAGAIGAMNKLGISTDAFNKLGTYDQMTTLGTAIQNIQDPTQQAAAAAALFGKTWKEILPAIKSGMKETGDQASVMSDQTVTSLDRIGDTMKAAQQSAVAWGGGVVLAVEGVGFAFGDFLSRFDPEHLGAATSEILKLQGAINDPDGLQGALASIKPSVMAVGEGVKTLGSSAKDTAEAARDLTDKAQASIEMHKQWAKAAKEAADAAEKFKNSVKGLSFGTFVEDTSKLQAIIPNLSSHTEAMASIFADVRDHMDDLTSSEIEFNRVETETGAILGGTAIPMFQKLTTGVLPQMTKALEDATVDSASFGDTLKQNLSKSLGGLNDVFQHAFEGGGGAKGAMQSFATNALSGVLSAIPAIGPVLSQFSGAIVAGFKKLFGGPSQQELDGRKVEADFEKSFGGFQQMLDSVGGAYAATGRGAASAQADVKALMDAEKNGGAAVQTMIDKINGAFADQKTKAATVSTAVDGILSTAKTVGSGFPDAMKPMIEQLAQLPGLTDDEKSSLLGLTDAVKPNFADLTSTAKDYGLTLTDLGPAFEQADISGRADKILTDFGNLDKAGANSDAVLHGMGKSINDLVNDAIKYGSTLPTALQPLVKQLSITGQLSDDAGDKITDLSKIKFNDDGDPLAKGMSGLTDAINHLNDLLDPKSSKGLPATATAAAGAIGTALAGIKGPTIPIHFALDSLPTGVDMGGVDWGGPQAAGGVGRVTRPTLFLAGEDGAEDVAFSGGGKSFGAMGGVTIQVVNHIEGNVWTEHELAGALSQHIADSFMNAKSIPLGR